jgi:hypothetical protein
VPWTQTSSKPAAAAARPLAGKGKVAFAPGTDAATWTTPISIASSAQAGMARRPVSQAGAPSAPNQPAAKATAPAAMAGGTSGTASRFAAGAIGASRPNVARAIGRVAAWAASETPRLSLSAPGIQRALRSRSRVSGEAQATSPAVAAAESWKPTSATVDGLARRSAATAQDRPTVTLDPRPLSIARSAVAAMTAARTTEAEAPANAV